MPSVVAMYDCLPCGTHCESRWFCHGSTCLRREAPRVQMPTVATTVTERELPGIDPQLLLPWTGVNDD